MIKPVVRWLNRHLLLLCAVGIWILFIMFINFNVKVAENTRQSKDNTQKTQQVVISQNQILTAIKNLAMDSRTTSEQKANLMICMLQIPLNERTADAITGCRKQAETNATSETDPSSPSAKTDSTSINTDPAPTDQPSAPSTPQPMRVLGVPICVPDPFGLIADRLCVEKSP